MSRNVELRIEKAIIFARQADLFLRVQTFLAAAKHRLALAQRDKHRQERAYAEGRMDGRMVGRSAIEAAKVLYFDDGEAAVCYMNGVLDSVAGI